MTFRSKILSAAGAVLFCLAMPAPVEAALIDGGPVDGSVFAAAGLGDGSGWSHFVLPQIFGTGPGSNGMFVDGGTATFVLRSASYGHKFGVADYYDHSPSSVIFDTTNPSNDNPMATDTFSNPDTVGAFFNYVFFFQTLCSSCSDDSGKIYSDGSRYNDGLNQLDMAVYAKDGVLALFFDDGGPSGYHESCSWVYDKKKDKYKKKCEDVPNDDNDYNDMVVTIAFTPPPDDVPEPVTAGLLGVGLLGLGAAARRRRRS